MARRPQDVTDAEREVLRVLWDDGPATVRALASGRTPVGWLSIFCAVTFFMDGLRPARAGERVLA